MIDPIIKEVRRAREDLLKKHGSLRGLFAYLKEHPTVPGKKEVSFPPRRPKQRKRLATG